MRDERDAVSTQPAPVRPLAFFDQPHQRPPLLRPMIVVLVLVSSLQLADEMLQRLEDYLSPRGSTVIDSRPNQWRVLRDWLGKTDLYLNAFLLACAVLATVRRPQARALLIVGLIILILRDVIDEIAWENAYAELWRRRAPMPRSIRIVIRLLSHEILKLAALYVLLRRDVRDYYRGTDHF